MCVVVCTLCCVVVCSVGGVVCGVVWCCVVLCGVVRLGMRKTPPCVDSKRLRVCVQDASVCTGKTPACVEHRQLLKILLSAREFIRTTKAVHICETRSVFPNLSCGHLGSQRKQLLLKLCNNLLHLHRHSESLNFGNSTSHHVPAGSR